jgi:pimeloyl-ACP methyl ester carboxylesterase
MGLTDGLTLFVSSFFAITLTIFIVIYWKKIYRRTFSNLIMRLLIIVLCQALALVSIGLQVNRANGFYESWNDLFGTSSGYTQGIAASNLISPLAKSDLKNAEHPSAHSTLISEVITGASSQVTSLVELDMPNSAVTEMLSAHTLNPHKYRFAEFLTGFPSQPKMWFEVLRIDGEISRYNALHPDNQVIGVFPEINIAGHMDLECMNFPNGGPQTETWLSTDIHDYVAHRFAVKDSSWGIMGVSTGGWCASMLMTRHPNLYAAAVSIAGYYRPALPLTDSKELQSAMRQKYDFTASEKKLTSVKPMYLTASLGDRYSIRETKKFLAHHYSHLHIEYKQLKSGGHNSRVWVSLIPAAFDWLQRNIAV